MLDLLHPIRFPRRWGERRARAGSRSVATAGGPFDEGLEHDHAARQGNHRALLVPRGPSDYRALALSSSSLIFHSARTEQRGRSWHLILRQVAGASKGRFPPPHLDK